MAADFSQIYEQLDRYIQQISEMDNYADILPRLPNGSDITLDPQNLAQLIFQTGNVYREASLYLGAARGRLDRIKIQYDRALKRNRIGNNPAEREQYAIHQTNDLADELIACRQEVFLLEGLVSAAQNASESVRKVANYADQMENGYRGTERGNSNSAYDEITDNTEEDFDDFEPF